MTTFFGAHMGHASGPFANDYLGNIITNQEFIKSQIEITSNKYFKQSHYYTSSFPWCFPGAEHLLISVVDLIMCASNKNQPSKIFDSSLPFYLS
jgi:hypothetical protein